MRSCLKRRRSFSVDSLALVWLEFSLQLFRSALVSCSQIIITIEPPPPPATMVALGAKSNNLGQAGKERKREERKGEERKEVPIDAAPFFSNNLSR